MMNERKIFALGFFDGVHLGHQALLRRCVERAAEKDLRSAVFTFDRSPKEAVSGQRVPLLTTVAERGAIIRTLFPVEDVIVASFDRAMMTMSWQDFIDLLVREYGAAHLVAGHDFRFGHKGSGTADLLQSRCTQLGLGCDILPAVTLEGTTVTIEGMESSMFMGINRRETGVNPIYDGAGRPVYPRVQSAKITLG